MTEHHSRGVWNHTHGPNEFAETPVSATVLLLINEGLIFSFNQSIYCVERRLRSAAGAQKDVIILRGLRFFNGSAQTFLYALRVLDLEHLQREGLLNNGMSSPAIDQPADIWHGLTRADHRTIKKRAKFLRKDDL